MERDYLTGVPGCTAPQTAMLRGGCIACVSLLKSTGLSVCLWPHVRLSSQCGGAGEQRGGRGWGSLAWHALAPRVPLDMGSRLPESRFASISWGPLTPSCTMADQRCNQRAPASHRRVAGVLAASVVTLSLISTPVAEPRGCSSSPLCKPRHHISIAVILPSLPTEYNDTLAAVYLSTITRGVAAANDIVDKVGLAYEKGTRGGGGRSGRGGGGYM